MVNQVTFYPINQDCTRFQTITTMGSFYDCTAGEGLGSLVIFEVLCIIAQACYRGGPVANASNSSA